MHLTFKLKAVTLLGIVSLIIGTLVVIGWLFDIPNLQTVIPKFASMKFNTALGFILLGILLLAMQYEQLKYGFLPILFLSLLITTIGGLSLVQTLFDFNAGSDQLFITDVTSLANHLPYPGRMSVNTSMCFILLGFAIAGFKINNNFISQICQYFLNLVTAIAALALIGYLYGLSLFYTVNFSGSMAVHTALLFFFISIFLSLQHPSIGITSLFTGNRVGNAMARRLFFIGILIIVMFGALHIVSEQLKLFSFITGFSILLGAFLCAVLALVWHMVIWVNKLDLSRHVAEQEVKSMNEQLEKRVKERSAKLLNMLAKFRESESKFKAAFEHSAIGMALVSLKGKWLRVNRSLCDMVGYKEQELLSLSFIDITHPDDLAMYQDLPEQILNNENNTAKIEKRYVCKDGTILWISVNIAPVSHKKGGPVYFVTQFEDITERKKAEASLKTAYKEIKEHMNNIQTIAWKQSHLVRSPLANLKGLTELLLENSSENELLPLIQKELDKLDNVILEMAEDAAGRHVKKITARKRAF